MRFEVRAYENGHISSIIIDAVSQADVSRQLSERAIRPIGIRKLRQQSGFSPRSVKGRFHVLLFSQELLALLEAGLAIIEALETLAEREPSGETRGIVEQLVARVREGKSLSSALATIPEAFPALFTGIVRSSERTGDLKEALGRYVSYRTRLDALRGKLISTAIYPSLLLVVGIAVTLFLGCYVVPKFAMVYRGSGRPLPWASQLLLSWGDLANKHGTVLLAVALGLLATLAIAIRQISKRGDAQNWLRRMPMIGERLRVYDLSRLYLTLGMLFDSGLPVMRVMEIAGESLPLKLRTDLSKASSLIGQGARFSDAFRQAQLTTAVGLRMMRIGEEAGRLGEMMTRAARFHDDETARWLERFSRAAEPTLMIAIGLLVGTIVVLLYMPIFDLAGSI